jgi:hypothetical protein
VPVDPHADRVTHDRPGFAVADRPIDGPAHRWRQWDEDDLAALAAHP